MSVAVFGDSERDLFDWFGEVVDSFGGGVGEAAGVPGADLVSPALQSPPEEVRFGWVVGVLEIFAEAGHELGAPSLGRCGRRWSARPVWRATSF